MTTIPTQSRNCYKSVLSWPPHPPKVETVKNQFFQDHHTLPQRRNCSKSVLLWPPHPPKVETATNQLFKEESPAGNPDTRLPLQTKGVTNSAACLGMSACTACTPPGLGLSAACLGMSVCAACTPPGLRLRSPGTLRRSHQQATPTLDCTCRPEEMSPTLLPVESVDSCSRFLPKGRKKMEELHVFKITRIFVIFLKFIKFTHSTGSADKISSFKTTTPSQSRNCSKSVLSWPPHPLPK